jgi:DNA-directed RNA polymerase specialized sigma subunit
VCEQNPFRREDLDAAGPMALRLRFVEDLTQSQIGARVGALQMQVSRMIRQAVGRLREAAALDTSLV